MSIDLFASDARHLINKALRVSLYEIQVRVSRSYFDFHR